jgi:hypothetical protein
MSKNAAPDFFIFPSRRFDEPDAGVLIPKGKDIFQHPHDKPPGSTLLRARSKRERHRFFDYLESFDLERFVSPFDGHESPTYSNFL